MTKAYVQAVRLLARREHGAHELAQKLAKKQYDLIDIQDAISECQRLGLQSDQRFAESLCRVRMGQGYGPLRIRQDLQAVKIDETIIEETLAQYSDEWLNLARQVWIKKYQKNNDASFDAIQKQKKFLLYRGFSMQVIHFVFKESNL